MIVLVILLIAAGIAIFVLYKRVKDQLIAIQNYKNEINNLKEQNISTEKRLEAEYKTALESKTAEFQTELESKIGDIEKKHEKEIEDLLCKVEAHKDELYLKSEKDILVDVALGLDALSKSQEAISNRVFSSQEEVKAIKENLFNIGDSVLQDISNGHAETIAKLGVHGDMSVASILADILEIMSKK